MAGGPVVEKIYACKNFSSEIYKKGIVLEIDSEKEIVLPRADEFLGERIRLRIITGSNGFGKISLQDSNTIIPSQAEFGGLAYGIDSDTIYTLERTIIQDGGETIAHWSVLENKIHIASETVEKEIQGYIYSIGGLLMVEPLKNNTGSGPFTVTKTATGTYEAVSTVDFDPTGGGNRSVIQITCPTNGVIIHPEVITGNKFSLRYWDTQTNALVDNLDAKRCHFSLKIYPV